MLKSVSLKKSLNHREPPIFFPLCDRISKRELLWPVLFILGRSSIRADELLWGVIKLRLFLHRTSRTYNAQKVTQQI